MTCTIKRSLLAEMVAHSMEGYPNEACGIVAALDGQPVKLYRTTNRKSSPVRYEMDASELYRIMKDMDARGWHLFGIFHSHTHSPAYPSLTDVELAYDRGAIYFIVSLMCYEPVVRAYRIVEGRIEEELIVERHD